MNTNTSHKNKMENIVLIPIILLMGFIPLIVHTYQYNSNLSQFEWAPMDGDTQIDSFFGWKMIAIIIVGILMVGVLLYKCWKKKENFCFENSFYFLFAYAMFVAMSALFSNYKYWVVRGTFELFEPVWVVFTYILLCYYSYNFVKNQHQLMYVLRGAGIGMTLVAVIGVFQFWGLDFFKSSFGKHVVMSPKWWNQMDQISFSVGDHISYTTLYNPNFLGFYFGMLIPLLVCIFCGVKKIWQRILIGVAEICCIICLIGSRSTAGVLALAIGCVILVLVLLSRKKKMFCIGAPIIIACGLVVLVVGGNTSAGLSLKNALVGTYHAGTTPYSLSHFEVENENAILTINGNKLCVTASKSQDGSIDVVCLDENGNTIAQEMYIEANQQYKLKDSRFENVLIQPVQMQDGTPAVSVWIDWVSWNFVFDENEGCLFYNSAGKLVKDVNVKNADWFNEDAFSYRGHIWNLTIPILGKHVFMGSGANTFMFEYPQNDYLYRVTEEGAGTYDVKAHCWYLQQWVENGLIGTLSLIVFLGWYLVRSIRIYRRVDFRESISWIGFGLFAAILIYLIVALVNDSNVCTAPVFWGMLGLGLAVNRMIIEEHGLFVETVVEEHQSRETENRDAGNEIQAVVLPKTTSAKKQSRKKRKNQKEKKN